MKTKLTILTIILASSFLFGQKDQIRKADKYFDQFGYIKASVLYKGLPEEVTDKDVLARLGESFYKNTNIDDAVDAYRKWYEQSVNSLDKEDSGHLLMYALSLHSQEATNIALDVLKKYNELKGRPMTLDPDAIMKHLDHLKTGTLDSITVKNWEFNTKNSEFGSFIIDNKMYISSADSIGKKYLWNEQPFLDIYEVFVGENNSEKTYSTPKRVSGDIDNTTGDKVNTDGHEASVAITSDGKTMYFDRNILDIDNQIRFDENGTSNITLCRATLKNGKWIVTDSDKTAFESINNAFRVNNKEKFSIGGPALSPDNKKLYFVSDAEYEGAMGQTDLYYVDIIEHDGGYAYGAPKNLGPEINTEGRELFPHISKNNILYFSSDGMYNGKLGLGLLDIYKTSLNDRTDSIQNMMTPFNSRKDDFAIFIEEYQEDSNEEKFGYFSSNRNDLNAKGNDDIYSFRVHKKQCKQKLTGVCRNSIDNEPLDGALVELFNEDGEKVDSTVVDKTGVYNFDVECNQEYKVKASKPGFDGDEETIITSDVDGFTIVRDLILTPPCVIKTDPIEFDFDMDYITEAAAEELRRTVIDTLKKNRELRIRIESHTDSRGSDEYNLDLSDRRAKSTKQFLLDNRVNRTQIMDAKGYGESRLCFTDEEIDALSEDLQERAHRVNRRSRFVIVDPNCPNTEDCVKNIELINYPKKYYSKDN